MMKVSGEYVAKLVLKAERGSPRVMAYFLLCLLVFPFAYYLVYSDSITIAAPVQLSYLVLAENLARTGSYTYAGTPYTLLPPAVPLVLAALMKVGLGGLSSYKALSFISLILSCIILYTLSLKLSGNKELSLVSAILLASNPIILTHVFDYFPDVSFLFLVLLWISLLHNGRFNAAAIVAGVSSLARLQGFLLIAFGILYLVCLKDRKRLIAYAAICAILPLIWGVRNIAVLQSGYGMPLSVIIAQPSLIYMTGVAYPDIGPSPIIPKPHILFYFVSAYLISVIGGFAAIGIFREWNRTKLMAAFIVFYSLAHVTLLGGMDNIVRHMMPVGALLCYYAASGLYSALSGIKYRNLCLMLVILVLLVAQANITRLEIRKIELIRQQSLSGIKWLNEHAPKDAVIADLVQPPHSMIHSHYYSNLTFVYAPQLMEAYNPNAKYALRQLSLEYPLDDSQLALQDVSEYADYVMAPADIPTALKGWKAVYNYSVLSTSLNGETPFLILENPRHES